MIESATEALRRMLDERGVEYEEHDPRPECIFSEGFRDTRWGNAKYREFLSSSNTVSLNIIGITPEQAIAATLGNEREKELELLVGQLWYLVNHRSGYGYAAALEAIEELGIEVES